MRTNILVELIRRDGGVHGCDRIFWSSRDVEMDLSRMRWNILVE